MRREIGHAHDTHAVAIKENITGVDSAGVVSTTTRIVGHIPRRISAVSKLGTSGGMAIGVSCYRVISVISTGISTLINAVERLMDHYFYCFCFYHSLPLHTVPSVRTTLIAGGAQMLFGMLSLGGQLWGCDRD